VVNSLLVDSGAWYALADTSDRHHEQAKTFMAKEGSQHRLVTTNAVMWESWALLNKRLGRESAMLYWQQVRESGISVMVLDERDEEAAWHIAKAYPDQDFSLVDLTSFAVMERLGISMVWTFDAHFLAYRYGPRRDRAFACLP